MVNVGALMAEIGAGVWDTPANFNGFRVLASLLHQRRSTKVNQTLHYIYIFAGSCPLTEFYQVQSSHYVQVLRSSILAALLHVTRVVSVNQTLRRWADIFGRAAITLDIGPHCSFIFVLHHLHIDIFLWCVFT